MTDEKPVCRNPAWIGDLKRRGLVTLADQAVVSGTSFLTSIIIARAVLKDEFGLYVLAAAILVVMINLQVALISTPYTYLSPRLDGEGHQSYSGSTLIHLFGLSIASTLFLAVSAVVSSENTDLATISRILWILAVVISLILLREYCRRFLFANLLVKRALIFDIVVSFIQIFGLVFLFIGESLTVDHGLLWIGISSLIPCVVLLISVREFFVISKRRIAQDLRQSWSIARWSFAEVMAKSTGSQSYPWILAFFHGSVAAGSFGACMGPVLLANPVFIGMANFFAPNVAHQLADEGLIGLKDAIRKTTFVLIIFVAIFSIFMSIFGDRLVILFYGEQYGGNGLIVTVLALSLIPVGCTIPIQSGLVALGRPDVGFKSYCLSLTAALSLGVCLIRQYGVLGVAVGLLVGSSLASGWQYFCYRKVLRRRMEG